MSSNVSGVTSGSGPTAATLSEECVVAMRPEMPTIRLSRRGKIVIGVLVSLIIVVSLLGKLAAELDRAIQQFVSFGQAAPVRLKIRRAGWANVNRAGDYNSLHNHPQQHLAAVYYVKASPPGGLGTPDGLLELRDPRPAAGFNGHATLFSAYPMRFAPEPGMLVMFPAFVDHI